MTDNQAGDATANANTPRVLCAKGCPFFGYVRVHRFICGCCCVSGGLRVSICGAWLRQYDGWCVFGEDAHQPSGDKCSPDAFVVDGAAASCVVCAVSWSGNIPFRSGVCGASPVSGWRRHAYHVLIR